MHERLFDDGAVHFLARRDGDDVGLLTVEFSSPAPRLCPQGQPYIGPTATHPDVRNYGHREGTRAVSCWTGPSQPVTRRFRSTSTPPTRSLDRSGSGLASSRPATGSDGPSTSATSDAHRRLAGPPTDTADIPVSDDKRRSRWRFRDLPLVDEPVSNDDAPFGRPIELSNAAHRTAADVHQALAQAAELLEDVSIVRERREETPPHVQTTRLCRRPWPRPSPRNDALRSSAHPTGRGLGR